MPTHTPAEALRLTNATVVDVRTGALTPNATLTLEGGKIQSVRTGASVDSGIRSVDAAGKFVVPGYLDMHVHSVEGPHPEHNMSVLLSYGVTGIRQMAGTADLLAKRAAGAFDFGDAAPELLAMPGSILTANNAETPEQGVEEVRKQKTQGADFIKSIAVTPKTYFATLAEARKLGLPYGGHMSLGVNLEDASNAGLSFIEHLGGPFEMTLIQCSKIGWIIRLMMKLKPPPVFKMSEEQIQSPFGQLLIANPVLWRLQEDPKVLDKSKKLIDSFSEAKCRDLAATFVKNQTWQCPTIIRGEGMRQAHTAAFTSIPETRFFTPAIREQYLGFSRQYEALLTPERLAILDQIKQMQFRVLRIFEDCGVPIMTGSDYGGGWIIPGFSMHQEFDLLEEAGITPLRVLQQSTLAGAQFLGREATMGTVEEGKNADLVVLDANPIESVQNLHAMHAVVRAGRYYSVADLHAMRDEAAAAFAAS